MRRLVQIDHSTEAFGPQSPLYRGLWTTESTLQRPVDHRVHNTKACGLNSPLYKGLWTTQSTLQRHVDQKVHSTMSTQQEACDELGNSTGGLWTRESTQQDSGGLCIIESTQQEACGPKSSLNRRPVEQRVHFIGALWILHPQSQHYKGLWSKGSTLQRPVDYRVHFTKTYGPQSPLYKCQWTPYTTIERACGPH